FSSRSLHTRCYRDWSSDVCSSDLKPRRPLWRATTADAVYAQPNVSVAGTAGRGSAWTGAYGQLRADDAFDDHLTGAIELVHFEKIGRASGGRGGMQREKSERVA